MCNAPKFGELEERTGYGGGFNEREGIEYIKRDESDDEYDEFGRKKKKYRNRSTDEKEVKFSYIQCRSVRKSVNMNSFFVIGL